MVNVKSKVKISSIIERVLAGVGENVGKIRPSCLLQINLLYAFFDRDFTSGIVFYYASFKVHIF